MSAPGSNIRTFLAIAAALESGMSIEDVARLRSQVARTRLNHSRAINRDVSIVVQAEIRDKEILECFIEDTKRGERKGGGTGASRANEARKLKVAKWDMKHRRRYS